jgi:flagellar export protein FliJ
VKRYEFSLETVLRARRAQESVARADLLRANINAAEAEIAEGRRRVHYEEVIVADGPSFMAQRERSELAAGALIDSRGALAEARAAVTMAMEGYVEAARSVSVLEKLDERQSQEHAAAVQREETNLVDELVTSRYGRHHRGARPQAGR